MPRGNPQNLIQYQKTTPKQRQENARKAGRASAKAYKKRKQMKEVFSLILSLNVTDEEVKETLKTVGITDEDMNNQSAIAVAIMKKALDGDLYAAEFILNSTAESIKSLELQEKIRSNKANEKIKMKELELKEKMLDGSRSDAEGKKEISPQLQDVLEQMLEDKGEELQD